MSPAELVTVSPCSKLRALRFADANQFQAFVQLREADVVGRDAFLRVAKELLALLDGFPAFFERREVPLLAFATHDPQAPAPLIEREPPADRERLDDLVCAE